MKKKREKDYCSMGNRDEQTQCIDLPQFSTKYNSSLLPFWEAHLTFDFVPPWFCSTITNEPGPILQKLKYFLVGYIKFDTGTVKIYKRNVRPNRIQQWICNNA